MREIEDALRIAERSSDDFAVAMARVTLGMALVHRQTAAERDRGQKLLAEVSEVFLRRGYMLAEVPLVEVYAPRERAPQVKRCVQVVAKETTSATRGSSSQNTCIR